MADVGGLSEGQQRARRAVEDAVTGRGWDARDLAREAGVDPGTVGDFLNGSRWPRMSTRGKIEAAIGWPAGSIKAVAGGAAPPVTEETTVGSAVEDDAFRYQRPPGLSDAEWEREKRRLRSMIDGYMNELRPTGE